ncbi:MAG TPA: lysylphosphatidylglycerol synthase domain-containing protein [Pyrinomonadaceae bacterium]|nr:lysylphosphatidylglycerol synthase domain-containing protein [Pyrinomonadaceae bacterium]
MTDTVPSAQKTSTPRRFAPLGIVFGVVGLLLFGYFVRRAGVNEIVSGIRRLGTGFLLILVISSVRHIVRSLAWTKCVEKPYRLRFRDALAGRLMGDALGNIIPFVSVAVSEPSKAVFVKDRIPLLVALSALAVENIFYSLSVSLFIFTGTATLLLSFSLPKPLRYASIAALLVIFIIVPLGFIVIRRQARFLSGTIGFLSARGVGRSALMKLKPRAEILEERIYGFYSRNQRSLVAIFGLELLFHVAGVIEIYTTLSFISPVAPSWRQAFILESVNRIINVTFKFMPLRVGVDEGGTEQVSKVLGFVKATGVTLAIVRKSRDIFWSSVGVALLLRKGFSLRGVGEEAAVDLSNSQLQSVSASALHKES